MNLRKSLIRMSIKKQIFFGIYAIFFISCFNIFLYISIISIVILSVEYNIVKNDMERKDNISLEQTKSLMDLVTTTLIEQIKNEINLLRAITDNFNDTNFDYYNINNYNNNFYSFNSNYNDKLLNLLSPILEKTLEIHSFNINNIRLFDYFFLIENYNLVHYPFKENFPFKNLKNILNLEELIKEILIRFNETHLTSFLNMNNYIKKEALNHNEIFIKNPALLFFKKNNESELLNDSLNYIFSLSLSMNNFNDISNFTQNFGKFKNMIWLNSQTLIFNSVIESYLTRIPNVYDFLIIDTKTNETISTQECYILNAFQYLYTKSERKIENSENLTYPTINYCFNNLFSQHLKDPIYFQDLSEYDIQKKQFTFSQYSYQNYSNSKYDFNSKIIFKSFQFKTPSKYIRKVIKSNYYLSFTLMHYIVKIQNKIYIYHSKIKDIFINNFIIIYFCNGIIWFLIFIILTIFIFIESNNISKPIKILIKSISSSHYPNDIKLKNLDEISYKEDKDINDLFKICKKLIIGGFKHKDNYYKKHSLNVYNNISIVKTNNMMFNEYEIESKKDKKYKDIFGEEDINNKKNNNFENEVYHKFSSPSLEETIRKNIDKKIKNYDPNTQFLLQSTNNIEYKLLIMAHKDVENYLPSNNLYKLYEEEFLNKKKKKIK